jgi:hypothetical protein
LRFLFIYLSYNEKLEQFLKATSATVVYIDCHEFSGLSALVNTFLKFGLFQKKNNVPAEVIQT